MPHAAASSHEQSSSSCRHFFQLLVRAAPSCSSGHRLCHGRLMLPHAGLPSQAFPSWRSIISVLVMSNPAKSRESARPSDNPRLTASDAIRQQRPSDHTHTVGAAAILRILTANNTFFDSSGKSSVDDNSSICANSIPRPTEAGPCSNTAATSQKPRRHRFRFWRFTAYPCPVVQAGRCSAGLSASAALPTSVPRAA